MKTIVRIILGIALIAVLFLLMQCMGRAQTLSNTNPITGEVTTSTPVVPTTVSNLVTAVPAGITQVASDGYNFYTKISLTNPISVGVFGLQNGAGWGGGLEVNEVRPGATVNAGFAVAAIQREVTDAQGKKSFKLNFYDATINLSVSTVETIPILNLPLTLRIFSGPFVSLNGGVLMGEQSGATGDINLQIGKDGRLTQKQLDFGGGVVNCAGAAAAGLRPAMPMGHINFTFKF